MKKKERKVGTFLSFNSILKSFHATTGFMRACRIQSALQPEKARLPRCAATTVSCLIPTGI
jgi:hypothetical protein